MSVPVFVDSKGGVSCFVSVFVLFVSFVLFFVCFFVFFGVFFFFCVCVCVCVLFCFFVCFFFGGHKLAILAERNNMMLKSLISLPVAIDSTSSAFAAGESMM